MDWISEELPRIRAAVRPRIRARFAKRGRRERFIDALEPELETLFRQFHALYGWRWDFSLRFVELIDTMADAFAGRPKRMLNRRERGMDWMHDPSTTWAMGYVDRLAGDLSGVARLIPHLTRLGITHLHLMPPWRTPPGPDDGGYAVADYRSVRPDLGTIDDLRLIIATDGSCQIDAVNFTDASCKSVTDEIAALLGGAITRPTRCSGTVKSSMEVGCEGVAASSRAGQICSTCPRRSTQARLTSWRASPPRQRTLPNRSADRPAPAAGGAGLAGFDDVNDARVGRDDPRPQPALRRTATPGALWVIRQPSEHQRSVGQGFMLREDAGMLWVR